MERFNNFLSFIQKDKAIIITRKAINSVSCKSKHGRERIVKIPLYLNPKLSFLAGVIIGDGHLSKDEYKITIEMVSKEILEIIRNELQSAFHINLILRKGNDQRLNRKQRWIIEFHSKTVWSLFNIAFEIPYGRKGEIVKVPDIILKSSKDIIRNFITGYFLADGCFKQNFVMFSSISRRLIYGVQDLLSRFNISSSVYSLNNKKFNRNFFELNVRGENVNKFIRLFPETHIKIDMRGSPRLANGAGRDTEFQFSGDA